MLLELFDHAVNKELAEAQAEGEPNKVNCKLRMLLHVGNERENLVRNDHKDKANTSCSHIYLFHHFSRRRVIGSFYLCLQIRNKALAGESDENKNKA